MNTNEKQYEPCPLEEATHARTATGDVYELSASTTHDGQKYFEIDFRESIYSPLFATLGITPVRKAEVKPVEFVGQVGGTSFDGHYTEFLIRVKGNVGGNLGKDLLGRTLRFTEVQP